MLETGVLAAKMNSSKPASELSKQVSSSSSSVFGIGGGGGGEGGNTRHDTATFLS